MQGRPTRSYEPPYSASVQSTKLRHHPLLKNFQHQNINDLHEESLTLGQKVADRVATSMGSMSFIVIQSIILFAWIIFNTANIPFIPHCDPMPFILLKLCLSFQAGYAAPFILISQNRQAEKDRLKADQDYLVNLKAEKEVMLLLEKIEAQEQRELELLQKIDLLLTRTGRTKDL